MSAPAEIVGLLESVVGILLSGVRHRERAAFILCDEVVEMACKMRASEHDRRFDMQCGFHSAWNAEGVKLPPLALGKEVQSRRNTRNLLQHGSAAATVDDEYCADAICGAVSVIEHCWPGASEASFRPWLLCALRVVRLYSSQGDPLKRTPFEDSMRDLSWEERRQGEMRSLNEVSLRPGMRSHWYLAITNYTGTVEEVLNRLSVP